MPKRVIKVNVKLPKGFVATPEIEARVQAAANGAIEDLAAQLKAAEKIVADLEKKGIAISVEEILERQRQGGTSKTPAAKKVTSKSKKASGRRSRTVLSDEQKQALITDLKAGLITRVVAEKYGVSTATVANIKTSAGLTKKRG